MPEANTVGIPNASEVRAKYGTERSAHLLLVSAHGDVAEALTIEDYLPTN